MYILNHNPRKDGEYTIILEPLCKFWQLINRTYGGIVAESNSHKRLAKFAQVNKLNLKEYYGKL